MIPLQIEKKMSKRLENFRVGDRREAISLAFIRCLGFVAPVPREEDVGLLDAVLTLSELVDRCSYPTLTCGVQIKATSIDGIYFDTNALRNLARLPFPLFVVTRDKGQLTFYSSAEFRMMEFAWAESMNRDSATLLLGTPSSVFNLHEMYDEQILTRIDSNSEHWANALKLVTTRKKTQPEPEQIHFSGAPLIHIRESELEEDSSATANAVKVLNGHIRNEARLLHLGKLGAFGRYSWKTNELPEPVEFYAVWRSFLKHATQDQKATLTVVMSAISTALIDAPPDISQALVKLRDWLESEGAMLKGQAFEQDA